MGVGVGVNAWRVVGRGLSHRFVVRVGVGVRLRGVYWEESLVACLQSAVAAGKSRLPRKMQYQRGISCTGAVCQTQ